MSEQQQPVSETPTKEANIKNINKGRRRLSRVALATPVIASLASRHALAGNCLSNMLSGNLSNPDRGQCSLGSSPGGWGLVGGKIYTFSTLEAWGAIGFSYGSYNPSASQCQPANKNKPNCYVGGTAIDAVSALNKDGVPSGTSLRVVLLPELWPQYASWQLTRHLVCAYLNAALSEVSPSFQYILTKQQVLDLAAGTLQVPPGYTGLQAFLDSTWN